MSPSQAATIFSIAISVRLEAILIPCIITHWNILVRLGRNSGTGGMILWGGQIFPTIASSQSARPRVQLLVQSRPSYRATDSLPRLSLLGPGNLATLKNVPSYT